MKIVDFTMEHMQEATALALSNYQEEMAAIPILPQIDCLPSLEHFAENGLGTAAFADGRMVGFLGCFNPIDRAFMTNAKGTFSPVHAHAAVKDGRRKIYQYLYQTAAEKWARQGIGSHSIALYAHDRAGIEAFFTYGFGQRCVDAIRLMESVDTAAVHGYEFSELPKTEVGKIADLRRKLAEHVGSSPCFMR